MIKLSSLDNKTFLLVGDECQLMDREELLQNFSEFKDMEIYTVEERQASLDAESILEHALENEADEMYEDWFDNILTDITEKDKQDIQIVLDRILSRNPSRNIAYYQDKPVEVDIIPEKNNCRRCDKPIEAGLLHCEECKEEIKLENMGY